MNKERFFIIDGYGQIYRSYYAFASRPLLDNDGRNVSAIFGFFNSLMMILRDFKPDYLAVALDSKGKTFRHSLYPEYKANRQKTPEDLHEQIPRIIEILDVMGIKHYIKEGAEADDVIATLTANLTKMDIDQVIVTGDKDLLQLVSDTTFALRPPKKDEKTWRLCASSDVEEIFGVRPDQICDYLTILGDTSDNVPGIAGIGEKGAVKLLKEYDTLENAYTNIETIKGSTKTKLETAKNGIELSRTLIKLKDNLFTEKEINLDLCKVSDIDWNGAVNAFNKLRSKSLAASARVFITGNSKTIASEKFSDKTLADKILVDKTLSSKVEINAELSGEESVEGAASAKKSLTVENCEEEIIVPADFKVDLDNMKHLTGFDLKKKIRECIIQNSSSSAEQESLFYEETAEPQDDKLVLILQDIEPYFDVQIAGYLLDSEVSEPTLEDLCLQNNVDINLEYAEKIRRLVYILQSRLKQKNLDGVFFNLEMPLIKILASMENEGILLDKEVLLSYENELKTEISEVERTIYSLCGREFNIASPKQLQEVLFIERGLKPIKKTKSGYSTDSDVLEQLSYSEEDPLPALILKYRGYTKLLSTYVLTLPKLADKNNRVHTSFLQTGTATGRLSSKNPNLQNIPVRTEDGRKIRSAFIAKDGYTLLSADYAQIELAVLASLSCDKVLCDSFMKAEDVHRNTAAMIFSKAPELVTDTERRIAKTINFGVIYGMSAFRLAGELKISRAEAQKYIDTYFNLHSGVTRLIEKIKAEAAENGYVKTVMGHIRKVRNINSSNKVARSAAERVAVNSVIQGSAAEIVKCAMISLYSALNEGRYKSKILLQVHDEMILEVANDELDVVKALVKEKMEGLKLISLPLRVSLEEGNNWGAL